MPTLILAAPWILVALLGLLQLRRRPRLRDYPPRAGDEVPHVTVVLPARNEAVNIGTCLASILGSPYSALDVVVVDDRSVDGTGEIARAIADRSGGLVRLVEGAPLPEGWIGKPWACWQGYREARGELLLFTDADTRHDPELLERSVAALRRENAALVTVLPRQLLGSFWERLVMPHILLLISARYVDLRRVNRTTRPRDVIANGQFMLIRRDVYEGVGGHEALKAEVVEDLRLAQRVVEVGERIFLAHAEEYLETRMYRSLGGIVEGWSKNLAIGSRMTVPPLLRPATPWLIAAFLLAFWTLPPLLLAWALLAGVGGKLASWALAATASSVAYWLLANGRFDVPRLYTVLYPFGALGAALLFVRSASRAGRVVWKGREYGVARSPEAPTAVSRPAGKG